MIPNLGKCQIAPNGEERYCCPFCAKRTGKPDTEYHLYVNRNKVSHEIKGWFICQRCRARGPSSRLFGVSVEAQVSVSKWSDLVKSLKQDQVVCRPVIKSIGLPLDYEPVFRGTQAYEYLRERGISDNQIAYYRIGFGSTDMRSIPKEDHDKYAGSGRIIFPNFTDAGKVNYWVARTYAGHKVRYKNPRNTDAGKVIYNLANAVKYETVIITEGVISAIMSGKNAVATFGKNVTDDQVSMLVEASFSDYIVALDGDACKEAVELAKKLTRRNCSVKLVKFPYQDDPASVPSVQTYLQGALPCNHATFIRMYDKSM